MVTIVGGGVLLVVAADLLARQAASPGEQVIAVAGKEIVGLA